MAFVNEYISKEDRLKYKIYEVDENFIVDGVRSDRWAIDREKNIYLRQVTSGREEFSQEVKWTLYWKGYLNIFHVKYLKAIGGPGEPGWAHIKVLGMSIDKNIIDKKQQIIDDFELALIAYKDAGVKSKNTSFSIQLDY